jgi:Zn-dependent peptidase ImmA (M78 family)/DNA-binding XRE family transcriptional regulator
MATLSQKQNDESLNHRLRNRREELGASLDELAKWAGVEAHRLRQIEAGSSLEPWEFEAICRGLAVDTGALARGNDRTPRRSVARFRSAAGTEPRPQDLRTLALASELGRIGGFLASEIGQPSDFTSLRRALPISAREEPWKQGYRLGENARLALKLPSGPIKNLERFLTESGVHIARIELSSPYLDAASLWEQGSLPVILLNRNSYRSDSNLSLRALLAHELCHLLHDSGDRDLTTQLSWSEGTGNFSEEVEQRARGFAPAFLAPRDEVRSWFRVGDGRRIRNPEKKVEALARRWGFSRRGAVWHAKNCQIIAPAIAESLDRSVPNEEHAWNSDFEEAPNVDAGEASRVLRVATSDISFGLLSSIVSKAVATGVISEGRGREVVTWG